MPQITLTSQVIFNIIIRFLFKTFSSKGYLEYLVTSRGFCFFTCTLKDFLKGKEY